MQKQYAFSNSNTLKFILLLLAFILPYIAHINQNVYLVHIAGIVGVYIILAIGLNIIIGFSGLLNLGFMAFYAIGAYSSALLAIKLHLSFWLILPIVGIFVSLSGILLGLPTFRLRGDYLAIVTLGFGEIARLILNNWDALTNGPKGLPRVGETIESPKIFSFVLQDEIHFYYLILIIVLFSIFVTLRLDNSRLGRAWIAIREDEMAAETIGIDTTYMKLLAFGLGSFFAGLAGAIYTHWIGFITPEIFTFWESVLIVCMVILGGTGNVFGVILATVIIVGVPELLRDILGAQFVSYRMLIFGIAMILIAVFRPQGIIPFKHTLTARKF